MAKAKVPAIKKTGNDRREPTIKEAEAIAVALEAKAQRRARIRPPEVEAIYQGAASLGIQAPHSDAIGWGAQLMEAFGVDSYSVVERLMMGASKVGPREVVGSQADADAIQRQNNSVLAFVSSIGPTNTLEATLALQMLASHEAGMKMSAHLHNATTRDAMADYARLMNQCQRTFAAQIEALSRLRTGGKQQVEVRYVYVDARTQTVVNQGGGPGGGLPDLQQPQAPGSGVLGYAPAPGVPVWSADAERGSVPVASDQGEASLSDARRQEPRRASGRRERQLQSGPVDAGDDSRSGSGPRPRETMPGDAS